MKHANFPLQCNIVVAATLLHGRKLLEVQEIEVQAVQICEEDTIWCSDEEANAFGVYLRYTPDFQERAGFSPCDWVADFPNRVAAENFADLLAGLLAPWTLIREMHKQLEECYDTMIEDQESGYEEGIYDVKTTPTIEYINTLLKQSREKMPF